LLNHTKPYGNKWGGPALEAAFGDDQRAKECFKVSVPALAPLKPWHIGLIVTAAVVFVVVCFIIYFRNKLFGGEVKPKPSVVPSKDEHVQSRFTSTL
jgi:hypothetical protein